MSKKSCKFSFQFCPDIFHGRPLAMYTSRQITNRVRIVQWKPVACRTVLVAKGAQQGCWVWCWCGRLGGGGVTENPVMHNPLLSPCVLVRRTDEEMKANARIGQGTWARHFVVTLTPTSPLSIPTQFDCSDSSSIPREKFISDFPKQHPTCSSQVCRVKSHKQRRLLKGVRGCPFRHTSNTPAQDPSQLLPRSALN